MSRRRKLTLLGVPLLVLAIVLGVAALQASRVQATSNLVATTGQGIIKMLSEYKLAIQDLDVERAAGCYLAGSDAKVSVFGRTSELTERAKDGVRVYEWHPDSEPRPLNDQLSGLLEAAGTTSYIKYKLLLVEDVPETGRAVAKALLWLRGTDTSDRPYETFARYRMWVEETPDGWRIDRQEMLHGQTVTGDGEGFVDVTRDVGVDFVTHMNDDWLDPGWYPNLYEMMKYGSPGASAVDYDEDGWYDIFFGDGMSARLYRNRGDGTFYDATAEVGLPLDIVGAHVGLFADFDNDGDKDLYIGRTTRSNMLFRNDDGRFTEVSDKVEFGDILVHTASITDYDEDGLLDLYLGRYLDPRINGPGTIFYSRNSAGNTLLHNRGGLEMADVTEEAGVYEGGLALGTAWADYDEDGDEDLYVVNDYGRNVLYRNNGDQTFTDVAEESGTLDYGFGMSAAFADVDNDGDLDINTSGLHSGQRWYGQSSTINQYMLNSVKQGTILKDWKLYAEIKKYFKPPIGEFAERMIKGNSLLLNQGDGTFEDALDPTISPLGWFWGSAMFDYDNDGWQDIYTVNGWISGPTVDDL